MKKISNFLQNDRFALVIASLWQLLIYFRINRFIWEHGVVEPWFVSHGLMFYRDFSAAYLPLPKILMLPINAAFNWNLNTTVVLALIQVLATIFLIFALSGKFFRGIARTISIVFFILWFTFILQQNTFEMNLFLGFLILLAFGILISWYQSKNKVQVFLIGFILTIAVFSTQHTVLVAALFLAVMSVYFYLTKRSFILTLKKVVVPFAAGSLLITAPIILWFWARGALYDLYFWNVDYYLRSNAYPFNKLGYSEKDLVMFALVFTPFWLFNIYFLFSSKIKKLIKGVKDRNPESWQIHTLWLVLVLSLIPIFFGVFHPRRFLYVLPLLSFLAGWVANLLSKSQTKKLVRLSLIFILPLAIYSLTTILPWYKAALAKGAQYDFYNAHYPGDNVYETIDWVKQNTPADAKILVFSGNALIYFEAQRLPANNRTYPFPWIYEPFDEMKNLFATKPAEYWIVDERLFRRFVEWGYSHQSDFIREHLNDNYEKRASFEWMSVYGKKQTKSF